MNVSQKGLSVIPSCAEVVPRLLVEAVGRDLHVSHGATLALGQIVAGLGQVAQDRGQGLQEVLGPALVTGLQELVGNMVEKHKLRGLGGEMMRQAASHYIRLVSLSSLALPPATLSSWLAVLEENLSSVEAAVQGAAVPAEPALLLQLLVRQGVLDTGARDKLLDTCRFHLTGPDMARRGFSSALGALPAHLLAQREEEVILALIRSSRISEGTESWAEARRDSVRALAAVTATVVAVLDQRLAPHIYDCFLVSLEDYTIDRRGDTGAWVREAAMSGLETVTVALLNRGTNMVPESIIAQVGESYFLSGEHLISARPCLASPSRPQRRSLGRGATPPGSSTPSCTLGAREGRSCQGSPAGRNYRTSSPGTSTSTGSSSRRPSRAS